MRVPTKFFVQNWEMSFSLLFCTALSTIFRNLIIVKIKRDKYHWLEICVWRHFKVLLLYGNFWWTYACYQEKENDLKVRNAINEGKHDNSRLVKIQQLVKIQNLLWNSEGPSALVLKGIVAIQTHSFSY